MSAKITSSDEQRHYDGVYSRYQDVDDTALALNRQTLLRDLDDPARAVYERRRLYQAALDVLLNEALPGKHILDYGCGLGEWGTLMATEGAIATLLDLSPAAIRIGLRRAKASGVGDRVRGIARDASDLSCFSDGEFDLVFACAALHHTLKYPAALEELCRVIRPGGKLLLVETYGNNRALNFIRRMGWRMSAQPEEAGEDILLSDRELALLGARFSRVSIRPLNLLAMAKRCFRGRFDRRPARATIAALEAIDRSLLQVFPFLSKFCGEVIVLAVK